MNMWAYKEPYMGKMAYEIQEICSNIFILLLDTPDTQTLVFYTEGSNGTFECSIYQKHTQL